MRNLLKFGVLTAFLLGGAFMFETREIGATTAAVTAESFDDAASPRSLYVQNCARCHGSNGRAQTAQGRKVEADDLTSSESKALSSSRVIRLITNGKGKMPGFRRKLTAAQIASVAGYIKSL